LPLVAGAVLERIGYFEKGVRSKGPAIRRQ
jgi:hypothetical protein